MSQPLNPSITIQRKIRTKRNITRYDSIGTITKNFRRSVVVVPGHEVTSGVLTRDTDVSDLSAYMGEASLSATRGFPIVVGAFPQTSISNFTDNVSDLGIVVKIGPDFLFQKSGDAIDEDIYGEAGALTPDLAV